MIWNASKTFHEPAIALWKRKEGCFGHMLAWKHFRRCVVCNLLSPPRRERANPSLKTAMDGLFVATRTAVDCCLMLTTRKQAEFGKHIKEALHPPHESVVKQPDQSFQLPSFIFFTLKSSFFPSLCEKESENYPYLKQREKPRFSYFALHLPFISKMSCKRHGQPPSQTSRWTKRQMETVR